MAAVDVGAGGVPGDDLDDLFDYNVDNDIFRDVDTNMDVPTNTFTTAPRPDEKGFSSGLGLDEEIKVTKRRTPIAKLDENRLLSQAGIPKLRRTAKERLKFKGKGHEYSDVARLLNFYQLWLDDLYPRAKFADGLAIIEKLGHTKRMQTMRKEWINEGKPRENTEDIARAHRVSVGTETMPVTPDTAPANSAAERPQTPPSQDNIFCDLYDATPRASAEKPHSQSGIPASKTSLFISNDDADHDAPGDDLDALLAEDEAERKSRFPLQKDQSPAHAEGHQDFDDEMEAMVGLDW